MAPEALREDARRLHRRRVVQVANDKSRADRKSPRPALARWVVLRIARHLDDAEHGLPHGCVQNRDVAALHRRALRRRMRGDALLVDPRVERPVAAAANEQPARQSRSMMPATAIPKPTHIDAMP